MHTASPKRAGWMARRNTRCLFVVCENCFHRPASFTFFEKAMRLCRQVNETSSPARTSSVAAAAMETAFRQRVKYVASVDIAYKKMRELVKTLNPSALVLCAMTHAALAIGASAAVTLSQLT